MASSALGFTLGDATNAVLNSYVYDLAFLIVTTDRTSSFIVDDCTITRSLGEPGTMTARVKGGSWTPAPGNLVRVMLDGAAGRVRYFAGTVTACRVVAWGPTTVTPIYELDIVDFRWLLSRYALVFGEWYNVGINTVARDIVTTYQNGGFRMGYAPAALGNVETFTANGITIADALDQLAELAGAYWDVDADQRVHLFQTPDHLSAESVSVTNTSKNVMDLEATTDYADIATRVCVAGTGTTLTNDLAWDGDFIWVDSADPFNADTGTVLIGGVDVVNYSAVNDTSTVRNLVAATDRSRDWPAGTEVRAYAVVDDSTAQTNLATALDFSLSGIAVRLVDAPTLTYTEAVTRGNAELDRYAAGYSELRGTMVDVRHTGATSLQPGVTVSANVTAPFTISGDYRVQTVTSVPRLVSGDYRFARSFMAAPTNRTKSTLDRILT